MPICPGRSLSSIPGSMYVANFSLYIQYSLFVLGGAKTGETGDPQQSHQTQHAKGRPTGEVQDEYKRLRKMPIKP